jgi:hypothetical protein
MAKRIGRLIGISLWAAAGCGGSNDAPASIVPTIDAAPEADAPADTGPDPNRIAIPGAAPYEKWTWVDVPEARCANDSPTGLAINPTTKSKRLLIFFGGGGVCWSDDNCLAMNLDGYGASHFDTFVKSAKGVFDRADPSNPFRDTSMVFLPYCTGDLHSGNKTTTYPTRGTMKHVGYANYGAYLKRIVPTFADTDLVVLAGTSAGGFGATWNYDRTRAAFGAKKVHLVSDSGTILRPPYYSKEIATGRSNAWGLSLTVPSGCTKCNETDGFWNIIPFIDGKYPDFRGSVLTSQSDALLGTFLGLDEATVTKALVDLETATTTAHLKYFFVTGSQHGFVVDGALSAIKSGDVAYSTFLEQQLSDDPGWKSVHP